MWLVHRHMAAPLSLVLLVTVVAIGAVPVFGTRSVRAVQEEAARDLFAILSEPASLRDRLPDTDATEEVDPTSSRLLTSTDVAAYWLGLDERGEVCLTTKLEDRDGPVSWLVATSCNPPSAVNTGGLYLQMSMNGGSTATMVVIRDGFDTNGSHLAVETVGGQMLVGNLIVFDAITPPDVVQLSSEDGAVTSFAMPNGSPAAD